MLDFIFMTFSLKLAYLVQVQRLWSLRAIPVMTVLGNRLFLSHIWSTLANLSSHSACHYHMTHKAFRHIQFHNSLPSPINFLQDTLVRLSKEWFPWNSTQIYNCLASLLSDSLRNIQHYLGMLYTKHTFVEQQLNRTQFSTFNISHQKFVLHQIRMVWSKPAYAWALWWTLYRFHCLRSHL